MQNPNPLRGLFLPSSALLMPWKGPKGFPPSLTVGGAEAILVGVICRCHLDGGRGGEHQDVCAGGVLGGVELGRLQVQCRAAPEHRAHRHCICGDRHQGTGVTAWPPNTGAGSFADPTCSANSQTQLKGLIFKRLHCSKSLTLRSPAPPLLSFCCPLIKYLLVK